jgi:opacity protein-like surface antigen
MRLLLPLLLGAIPAFSQPFSAGVKLGVPLTDFVSVAGSATPSGFLDYATHTNRYIVGATGELHLPFHLAVEVDVLYRHIDYQSTAQTVGANATTTNATTTGNSWEFPLLAKYRFGAKVLHPYVDAGVAWDTLQGLTQTVKSVVQGAANGATTTSSTPSELANSSTRGFVLGGGLDIKFLVIHIQPEIRYTRWGAKQFFDPGALLDSKQNQGEFLLGITF